ncbi:1908_t:CDS:2 [Ambispora gerdemannii]|uniref:Mitochondrial aspartate-glutamate transporter AGC1 n=1 Tax=Ambispora gerdemannii TaxID=144530 RepID=A0A9N8YSK4_9GLOM|nr:1908_t:CDS:2 [Ambispora gerdemannii]
MNFFHTIQAAETLEAAHPKASSSLEILRKTPTSEKVLGQQKRVFENFASVDKNGQKYMTQDDFIAAIAPDEDYKKIQKEQFAILFRVADADRKGLVSLQDFVVFENLLSKPDADYEIAFRLFDINGTGKVTFDQFKEILSANLGPDSVPFDYNCDWLNLYVGVDGKKHDLAYEEFSQLLKGIQGERLRQEFKYYDKDQIGFINPDAFKKIILSIAKHKLSDSLIEHLPTLCNVSAGNKISYANVVAFYNVVRQMDMVERIVLKAISQSSDGRITKNDFLNVAAKSTRFSLFTPLEADIIFHFAGLGNPSGRLGLRDFAQLLDAKWQQQPQIKTVVEVPTKKHEGIWWGILHQIYSFTLGAIAGSFGATAVYPIDLVKTRMQNQRSRVVGELLYQNSVDCFKKVVKNEGVLGLYSGLGPQLVGVAPEKAIKLTVNDFVRRLTSDPKTGEITLASEIFSGSTAGGCQVIFTNPLEIVKIRLQVQGEYLKMNVDAPRRSAIWIVKHLGIVGLYKGASACLLRDIPFSGIYFPAYAHLKKNVFKEGPEKRLSITELLLAGAIAGMPAAYFTTPADVIKTRLQVEARTGETVYNGIVDAARKIHHEEGFKAFFKGGPARVLRSSPQFGATLMAYEVLQRWLPWGSTEEKVGRAVGSASETGDLGYLRSRNALKILLDLDYKFGVSPKSFPAQQQQP